MRYKKQKPQTINRLGSLGFLLLQSEYFFVVCLTYGCLKSCMRIFLTPDNLQPLAISFVRYDLVVGNKIKIKDGENSSLAKRCNDFLLLEKACANYMK